MTRSVRRPRPCALGSAGCPSTLTCWLFTHSASRLRECSGNKTRERLIEPQTGALRGHAQLDRSIAGAGAIILFSVEFLHMRRSLAFVLALLVGWSLAACGLLKTDQDETKGWSAAKLYAEAKQSLSDRDYDQAIKYYQKLEARYPYGRFAQQAQIEIAYAHYKDERACAGGRRGRPFHQAASEPSERRLRRTT